MKNKHRDIWFLKNGCGYQNFKGFLEERSQVPSEGYIEP